MKKILTGLLLLPFLAISCEKDPFATNNSGTFTDVRDNQAYAWVKIGTQIWMAENLAWLPAVSPPSVLSQASPFFYVYGYNGANLTEARATANFTNFGVLYNWKAALTACPTGWHLPTDGEWEVLVEYLGGTAVAGKKMKSISGWQQSGNGDNSSGFNAQPAGGLDHKYNFGGFGYLAAFFSANENNSATSWYRGLSFGEDAVNRNSPDKSDGYSVRCLRD